MFICSIELRMYIAPQVTGGETLIVGRHQFDPGFKQGDEVTIFCEHFYRLGERYELRSKVVDRKVQIYSCDDRQTIIKGIQDLRLDDSLTNELNRTGIIRLSIILEAEDRDAVVKISEDYRKINPHLFSNPTE